jgi:hypothetical protein
LDDTSRAPPAAEDNFIAHEANLPENRDQRPEPDPGALGRAPRATQRTWSQGLRSMYKVGKTNRLEAEVLRLEKEFEHSARLGKRSVPYPLPVREAESGAPVPCGDLLAAMRCRHPDLDFYTFANAASIIIALHWRTIDGDDDAE